MKVVNFILGLGTAIILSALITLGMKAFYPEPTQPTYPSSALSVPVIPCASGDASCFNQNKQIEAQQAANQNAFDQQEQAYEGQMKVYDSNLFIIANIVGIIVFILGFLLLFTTSIAAQSVPIGIMVAGLWSIVYGYGRGWGSVNDELKFFIGLVIALLVIGGSMWLVERYAKKKGK